MSNKKTMYKIIIAILLTIGFWGCIDEIDMPNTSSDQGSSFLVIDGSILKGDTIQYLRISHSNPLGNYEFNPEMGCKVSVKCSLGDEYEFEEVEPGIYTTEILPECLIEGTSFQLFVETMDGVKYQSEPEELHESVSVDNIYFEMGDENLGANYYDNGAQFYVDLKAAEQNSKHYRWVVEETYEYHARYVLAGLLDASEKRFIEMQPEELMVCYRTQNLKEVFASSTQKLQVNEKKKIPLNYVPAVTNKLKYNYSILVKQYVLSDAAYEYWNRNMLQNSSSGGFYQMQPSQTKSNIHNVANSDEIVLGFFWVSSYQQKRFVLDKKDRVQVYERICKADTFIMSSNLWIVVDKYLANLGEYPDGRTVYGHVSPAHCLDCREKGGVLDKPDFFD